MRSNAFTPEVTLPNSPAHNEVYETLQSFFAPLTLSRTIHWLVCDMHSMSPAVLRSDMLQDNYPGLAITQLELSPFYLQEARKNMEYWRRMRGASAQRSIPVAEDRFLHAPAENIPAPDSSYDVVGLWLPHSLLYEAHASPV